uniref:Uncharacterized protein n=1 Tax=Lotharella globosa TaxID=91324 RepID=A0A7S3Z0W2_9EUKA
MLWAAAILFALFPPAGAAVATVSTISTRYGRPVGSHPHVRAVREHARKQGATARNALAPQRDNNAFVARTRTSIVPQSTDISAMEPNEKPGKVTLKDRFKNLFQKMNLDRVRTKTNIIEEDYIRPDRSVGPETNGRIGSRVLALLWFRLQHQCNEMLFFTSIIADRDPFCERQ